MAQDNNTPDDQLDTTTVLNIESHFYDQGFTEGSHDGVIMGRAEGRSLGLKTGFEKFLASGRIAGKTMVWANRQASSSSSSVTQQDACTLPPLLSANSRLRKNLEAVHALVEPSTLSTRNTDDAVNDFDDRLKRARGKIKVVERMLGEAAEK